MMEYSNIITELLKIEAESQWTSEDIDNQQVNIQILGRFSRKLLEFLARQYKQVDHAYIAYTGIQPGVFKPLESIGRALSEISITNTRKKNTLMSKILMESREAVILINNPSNYLEYCGDSEIAQKLVIRLIGYGEFFGFISLDAKKRDAFSYDDVKTIEKLQPTLSRIVADANFTMRLRQISNSFEIAATKGDLSDLYQEIVDRTVLAFGAAGAILRINPLGTNRLIPVAFSGDVDTLLLEDDSAGEIICRSVIEDEIHSWTVGMIDDPDDMKFSGTSISPEMENKLRAIGIKAYLVMELVSELPTLSGTIGTIAFFHYRPHRFSWRDIGLAKSFFQRAADIITLYRKSEELGEAYETLKDANELLYAEHKMSTKYEIVSLLTHDLGHKAIHASESFHAFTKQVKKALREGRQFPSIQNYAESVEDEIMIFEQTLGNINQMFKPSEEQLKQVEEFKFSEAIKEVMDVMEAALKRHNFEETDIQASIDPIITGNKGVLIQVLFNLLINSIDAQRSRTRRRRNRIHILVNKEIATKQENLVVSFWDDGPGINRQMFPNPNDIFIMGKSSKVGGTGSGLPITRNLISMFFAGSLFLEDSTKALFKIVLPIRRAK